MEYFSGKQMIRFSYLLCPRYNTEITCQALDFQLFNFQITLKYL